MDPTLSALIGIVTGGILGILGSVITYVLTTRREQRQWRRDRLVEAYSNSIYYLIAVTNWLYSGAYQEAVEKKETQEYLADANEADRWLQLLIIQSNKSPISGIPEFNDLEEFVRDKSFPDQIKDATPWTLNKAYELLTKVRKLAMEDERLFAS